MAKKYIKKPEDLPEWFNLDNYKGFAKLTLIEFVKQMIIRVELYQAITEDGDIWEVISDIPVWQTIKSGNPIIDTNLSNFDFTEKEKILSFTNIKQVDFAMVNSAALTVVHYDELYESDSLFDDDLNFQQHIGERKIWLEVDLNNACDEQLLNEIKYRLQEIRTKQGIQSIKLPKVDKQIGNLFLYQCHIYLDLLIWELEATLVNNQPIQIAKPLLLEVLFPKSNEHFNSTKDLENKTERVTKELISKDLSLLKKIQHTIQSETNLGEFLISTFAELKAKKSS